MTRPLLHCLLIFTFVGSCFVLSTPVVANDRANAEIAAARRQLERAQVELRLYVSVEYSRKKGQLDREITMAREILDSHRRRVSHYERFDRHRYNKPLLVSLENARLDVVAARLRLTELNEERRLLIRAHMDQCRLLELNVEAAKARLSQLLIKR